MLPKVMSSASFSGLTASSSASRLLITGPLPGGPLSLRGYLLSCLRTPRWLPSWGADQGLPCPEWGTSPPSNYLFSSENWGRSEAGCASPRALWLKYLLRLAPQMGVSQAGPRRSKGGPSPLVPWRSAVSPSLPTAFLLARETGVLKPGKPGSTAPPRSASAEDRPSESPEGNWGPRAVEEQRGGGPALQGEELDCWVHVFPTKSYNSVFHRSGLYYYYYFAYLEEYF